MIMIIVIAHCYSGKPFQISTPKEKKIVQICEGTRKEKEEKGVGTRRSSGAPEANLRSGVPFVFVGSGKERLIQLLDYSSAAP